MKKALQETKHLGATLVDLKGTLWAAARRFGHLEHVATQPSQLGHARKSMTLDVYSHVLIGE